jgi:hypothetical protein
MEVSNLRPAWRFGHISDKQKVHTGEGSKKKMLLFYERSPIVYENKENNDEMADEKSDIYGKVGPIFQKIASLDG